MPDADLSPADEQLCELLDRYVTALESGDEPARAGLLCAHPELASWAGSLESLDRLAADRNGIAPLPPHVSQGATTPWSGRDSASAATAAPTAAGAIFGNYELLEEAGRGGMGVVYKARQIDLDRIVALKMILSSRLASPQEVQRFQREARAAAGVRHPNIVGIHEVGQVHGQHYFTMDFVAGRSLAKRLEEGPLPPDRAARLIAAVARATDFLHAHGIVHRDLKPGNILLDEHEEPLVTDFGLAKVFQPDAEQTQSGLIVGTPGYMAPEQARGSASEISPRTDVYSLGAVLYEMLTGRPPFREENPLSTLLQVLEGEPTLPRRLNSRIPLELERICLRCLEKVPANRYASAAALAADLERYLRHEPLEAPPVGFRQRLRRWTRRQPALVIHGAGLLATGLVVSLNFLVNRPDTTMYAQIMAVLGVWLVAAIGFQWLLLRDRTAAAARYAWATADVLLLSVGLYLAGAPLGPLVVAYPLIVAGSALWFRVPLVAYTTALSLASYAVLSWLHSDPNQPAHYPLIFVAILTVLGFAVGYQLHRFQVLNRYFEQQRGR